MLKQTLIFSAIFSVILVTGCAGSDFYADDEGRVDMFKDVQQIQDAGNDLKSDEDSQVKVDVTSDTENVQFDSGVDTGYAGIVFENGKGDLCFDKLSYCFNKCESDSDCCQGGFCPLGIPRICVEIHTMPVLGGQKYCMPSCANLVYKNTAYTTSTFCMQTTGPLSAVCQPSLDNRPACLP